MVEGNEVIASLGVIATGPAEAARVGGRIFERGGNAIDAAAAACITCAVVEPQAVDLGGYVAAGVVLEGSTGRVWSIDGNSVAPAATREDLYEVLPPVPGKRGINELEYGCSVRGDANVYGPLSVGVPGLVGGVGTLWERWGRLPWPEIVEPARELIAGGLSYDLVRGAVAQKRQEIARFPETVRLLEDANWPGGGLARTLERLAVAGWRDFYQGELGHEIADFVAEQGGILTRGDMAGFTPRVTEPLTAPYGKALVHTAIAPNGGYSVLEALPELAPGAGDVSYWERLAGVLQTMWRRRLGEPGTSASPHGTVHVAAADREGNLVSMTISQGGLFGSCLAVPGTGVILGHGMCRFDPHPARPNSPGPGKRPLNNVCPLIIRMPDRDVAIGARGGRRIVSVAVQFAQRIVERGASAWNAAAAPRMHVLTDEPLEISPNFDPAIRAALEARGHRIEAPEEVAGAAHGAEILKGSGQLRAGGNTLAVGV
jgi:gamma-glutamyltranspeptidase / glutathione hydrolase